VTRRPTTEQSSRVLESSIEPISLPTCHLSSTLSIPAELRRHTCAGKVSGAFLFLDFGVSRRYRKSPLSQGPKGWLFLSSARRAGEIKQNVRGLKGCDSLPGERRVSGGVLVLERGFDVSCSRSSSTHAAAHCAEAAWGTVLDCAAAEDKPGKPA
jgi:hypothetical protein